MTLAIAGIAVTVFTCAASNAQTSTDEVRSEVLKAQEAHSNQTSIFQGHLRQTATNKVDLDQYLAAEGKSFSAKVRKHLAGFADRTTISEIDFKYKNGFALEVLSITTSSVSEKPLFFALLSNPKYSAHLSRGSATGDWLLQAYNEDPDFRGFRAPWPRETLSQYVRSVLMAGYKYHGKLIVDYLNDPTFNFSANMTNRQGKELVRLEFKAKARAADIPSDDVIRSGWMELDPSEGWHIKSSERISDNGKIFLRIKREHSYRPAPNGAWLPARIDHTAEQYSDRIDGKYLGSEIQTEEYDFSIPKDIPDREFTLSAFGLPEPEGVKWDKPTPRYVWILLAAGLCALFAVTFRWFARRTSGLPKTS